HRHPASHPHVGQPSMQQEKTIESKTVFNGRLVNLRLDTVALPDGGTACREIVEHGEVVFIVPVDADDNVLLVRQYRKPAEEVLLEIPAGGIDPGEEPADAAQRELREETGYMAGNLEPMASFYTSPGFCTEFSHLYLATDLQHDPLESEPDENIILCPVAADQITRLIQGGEIKDGKSIAGLLLYLTCYRTR
ncbi:MAG: NUDIX hydrolase, partial [Dehalococcoidia bacterium]